MRKLLPIITSLTLFVFLTFLTFDVRSQSTQDETCNPNEEWKNHGAYVSCVAHTHPGGQVVSQAAQSDIGKKNKGSSPIPSPSPSASPIVSPSPSASPISSPSPSASPEISPEPSASPEASPEVSPSPSPELTAQIGQIGNLSLEELIEFLENLLDSLKQLI